MKKPKDVVAVFDNGGATVDRYTIVYNDNRELHEKEIGGWRVWDCVGSNVYPTHPQYGFFQHSECHYFPPGHGGNKHLGKRIAWGKLPDIVKQCVINDCMVEEIQGV